MIFTLDNLLSAIIILVLLPLCLLTWQLIVRQKLFARVVLRRLSERKVPVSAADLPAWVPSSQEDEACGETYQRVFGRQFTIEELKSFESFCKLASPESRPSEDQVVIRMRGLLDDLKGITSAPRFFYRYQPLPVSVPAWSADLAALPYIASLDAGALIREESWDAAIERLHLASAAVVHSGQAPLPLSYSHAMSTGFDLVSNLVNSLVSAGFARTISPSLAAIASESVLPFPPPGKAFVYAFTWALDVIRDLPKSAHELFKLGFSPELIKMALGPKIGLTAPSDFSRILAAWDVISRATEYDQLSGKEMLNVCSEAEAAARSASPRAGAAYAMLWPNPVKMTQQWVAGETVRRLQVCAGRILLALSEGSSWKVGLGIDNCAIDPYTGKQFQFAEAEGLVTVTSSGPSCYGQPGDPPFEISIDTTGF